MEHLADEFDARRFVGVLLFEVHDQAEGAVFEGRVGWADDDGVPRSVPVLVDCSLHHYTSVRQSLMDV
jgi:hypothetical protein